ncbi:MAG: ATP-grasp domain-containing protein [Myxococcota bacterium]
MNQPRRAQRFAVLPAYGIGQSELRCCLESLRHLGLLEQLLLVCSHDDAGVVPPEVAVITDAFCSPRALAAKIERLCRTHDARVTAVVGIDEELHFSLSRRLALHCKVPFHSEQTCFVASNKLLCKQAFVRAGVPTSAFALVSEPGGPAARSVGFPNVLKTLSGTQSQYLFRNESRQALASNLAKLREACGAAVGDPRFEPQSVVIDGTPMAWDPRRNFLLEAYVPGLEYSCDFLVDGSEVRIIRIAKKIPGPQLGIFAGYALLDGAGLRSEGFSLDRLMAVCVRIAQAFQVRQAVCMVDFKWTGDALMVLESSVRPGFSAFNHLMYDLVGYTSLALMVAHALGQPVALRRPVASGAVVYLIAPEGEGGDLDTTRLQAHARALGITAIHCFPNEGESTETDPARRLRGYALVRDCPPERLGYHINAIQGLIDFREREMR